MAGIKYQQIFQSLRENIESGNYAFQEMLPSETALTKTYDCSRNTVRRALAALAERGYVQSMCGKGSRVIYQPQEQSEILLSSYENLKETARRLKKNYNTKVICFTELTVDEKIKARTTFETGTEIYYIQRVRYFDGKALIIDHNYLRKDIVRNITKDIAEQSVYEYLENELGEDIVTTKKRITVEHMTELDEKYMDLKDFNCVVVVSGQAFNADGVMFEYTQSRHKPDSFVFYDQARRGPAADMQ